MCNLPLELLSEKLIEDFYDQDHPPEDGEPAQDKPIEQLKLLIPRDHWELLFQVESETTELGSHELKRFSRFVARLLLGTTRG